MFRGIDAKVDSEGDLVIDGNGDIKLSTTKEALEQDILFRIKTDHHDYAPFPFIGANLGKFIDTPNTKRQLQLITEHAGISLSQDPIVPPGNLYIDAVPVGPSTIALFVLYNGSIDGDNDPSTIVTYTIKKEHQGVDNESIVNTTVL